MKHCDEHILRTISGLLDNVVAELTSGTDFLLPEKLRMKASDKKSVNGSPSQTLIKHLLSDDCDLKPVPAGQSPGSNFQPDGDTLSPLIFHMSEMWHKRRVEHEREIRNDSDVGNLIRDMIRHCYGMEDPDVGAYCNKFADIVSEKIDDMRIIASIQRILGEDPEAARNLINNKLKNIFRNPEDKQRMLLFVDTSKEDRAQQIEDYAEEIREIVSEFESYVLELKNPAHQYDLMSPDETHRRPRLVGHNQEHKYDGRWSSKSELSRTWKRKPQER